MQEKTANVNNIVPGNVKENTKIFQTANPNCQCTSETYQKRKDYFKHRLTKHALTQ